MKLQLNYNYFLPYTDNIVVNLSANSSILNINPAGEKFFKCTELSMRGFNGWELLSQKFITLPIFLSIQSIRTLSQPTKMISPYRHLTWTAIPIRDHCNELTNIIIFARHRSDLDCSYQDSHQTQFKSCNFEYLALAQSISKELKQTIGMLVQINRCLDIQALADEQKTLMRRLTRTTHLIKYQTQNVSTYLSILQEQYISCVEAKFNVLKAIKDVIDYFDPLADKHRLQIDIVHSNDIPEEVIGDEEKFMQIVFNLLNCTMHFVEYSKLNLIISMEKQNETKLFLKIKLEFPHNELNQNLIANFFAEFNGAALMWIH